MSVGHYENFPVGSLLLPARIRPAVHAIYHFARSADDLVDEGDAAPEARLAALDDYRQRLLAIAGGGDGDGHPVFAPLAEQMARHALPAQPFLDLLSAFSQDVSVTRYASFADLIGYCRRSANPVGRLMLHLFNEHDSRSLAMSDGICTALQLTNFWQDVALDWQKGRVYLPQDALAKYRISEAQIAAGDTGGLWSVMMREQIGRARSMLAAGAPLARQLPGRFGLELRLIVLGGETILRKLHQSGGDVFRQRPTLQARDWLYMGWRALRKR